MKKWISCCSIWMLALLAIAQRPAKPNFVILLADDLGWQDVGCYDVDANAVYETPYMDQLASEGIRFTQGYSPTPVCGPSRYGILSGRFPARGKTSVQGGECPKPYTQSFRMMDPYYTGRMELEEITIAEALRPYGYLSGHSGKWHVAVNHNSFPQPGDQGFDFSEHDLGISRKMSDRLTGFATIDPSDAYQLQDLDGNATTNGYAFDQTTQDIIDFMEMAVASNAPFFSYYAAWYVHAPIQTRTERLLEKYALKMGYSYPLDGSEDLSADAQINPYYGAMVEEFDFNVQRIIQYLKNTDDPRWPGHKLIENTYLFLTSDNGGMEGTASETYTDNDPLDRGKIRAEEGGVRVPYIVVGPDVPTNVVSDVMVNGLDFYPTMLSLAGIPVPERLEGCNLRSLLLDDPQDSDLVKHFDGSVRDTMYWHFPHGGALHSTIRKNGWKLFRNYDWLDNSSLEPYRLYKLYDTDGSENDIGENSDLVDVETAMATQLSAELNAWLSNVNARLPHYNPTTTQTLTNKENVPAVLDSGSSNGTAWVAFQENGAAVVHADLIYTLNGDGSVDEEWFRMDAQLDAVNGRAEAVIPDGTTHYVFNLIDENNFLVSSVDVGILSNFIPDSEVVPEYEPTQELFAEAGFTNVGTAYPTNEVLLGSSISDVNGVPVRDNDSYTTAVGQTFTLTNSATLTALTLKGGNNKSFGSGDHKVALWIGGYNNGTPGETRVYEYIDLENTSVSSGPYYTIDFADKVFPAGRYSFQLGWTTNHTSHDIRFFRASGTGTLDGEGRLYGNNVTALPFSNSNVEDNNDVVYALHGSAGAPDPDPNPGIADNNLNYTYLYFENGLPTPMKHRRSQSEANAAARANPDLVIQTGYYSLLLDCDDMDFKGYDALAGSDYRGALTNDVSVFTLADLILSVVKDGTNFTCTSASVQNSTNQLVRLIQSNRYVQRFDHLGLLFKDSLGNTLAGVRFEMTAWADRVALKLDASDVSGVTETSVKVVSPFSVLHESTVAGDEAVLAIQPHTDTTLSAWNPGDYIVDAYNRDTLAGLAASFDADEFALHIDVPATSISYPADTNRVDEYVIEVTNPEMTTQNIPLIFEQPTPRAITGTVMLMCEEDDGRPTGIPVQISKNWHKDNNNPTVHQGSWLRGYTMLNLAAGETKRFRLRVVYGYWGGAGAISHSQLSLIGWGKNWKWDESALGAWGESCTYDPCLHAGAAFMDDIRPAFTTPMNGGTDHNWTENSGGGDFLIYRDSSNTYRWIKRLKTAYLWTGPNMTEVLYSGLTDDDKIRVTYSSRAVRTSDYHRRFHGYTYEFLDDVTSPERLVFHQMAADYYTGPTFTNYYRGDESGLLSSYVANPGGNTYKETPVQFNNQWLSIDDGMSYDKVSRSRRGLLNLSSTLNGSAFPLYMHTYGRSWGSDRMMFDFSANSVERSYSAGDVVEGEFEFIMPPNEASVYWGNDTEFASRLAGYGSNAWNAVHDEFRYNAKLDLAVHEGTLLRNYPIEIQSSENTVLADFTIYSGGIGHVPVVVKGVESGLALQAQRWSGGSWVPLETADVTENDDYQGVQNADGTMDVVFNMPRPSSGLNESWRIRIVSGSATVPQGNYADWIHGFGLNGTNLANTANPDLDYGNNLYEYAMGGNPTNPADIGYLPTSGIYAAGGVTNWFEYIHARRKNSEGELSYVLEASSNLVSNDWNTVSYIELPMTGNLDADYESVTNRIDTTGKTNEFIRLKVEVL
ncbi:Arylsulfatase [Pontiella desulfatans]|uniref:Arylsulfatase n=1 Tax=Pontiella desulfatans TaxID=2750659 RepID=A0A6C2TZ91_PONDE|nr:sulfatase-like hydrolase/transferase [Pontiella desulfatans]SPS73677.1 sulfatase S1_16 [Kiritimatiellales bacterium]VGO12506.1 Arylsulfatase [Pontiella desulfatans]